MRDTKIRTFVVDDSTLYRGIISKIVQNLSQVEYIGSAANGEHALAKIGSLKPDLVTLDIEMPGMNGIEVLERIKNEYPDTQVIMISGATASSADNTIQALRQGALDFILKPQSDDPAANERDLTRQLRRAASVVETKLILKGGQSNEGNLEITPNSAIPGKIRTRQGNTIEVVVFGVSTGGPQSLPNILDKLPPSFGLPILIIQHMPPLFVSTLVNSLNRTSQVEVVEAKDGMILKAGKVYMAPGGEHTRVIKQGNDVIIKLTMDPPVNFCRPSVDYTFRSVAEVYREKVLAVILTGMGRDGVEGMRLLKDCGAVTIAQDKFSSVVFGMPHEAIKAGVVDYVLPLDMIAEPVLRAAR